MTKKRIVSIIAVLMLVVMTFAGCGNKGPQIESDLSMADEVQAFTDAIDAQYAYDLGYLFIHKILTYYIYNPFTNVQDDVLTRMDFIIDDNAI